MKNRTDGLLLILLGCLITCSAFIGKGPQCDYEAMRETGVARLKKFSFNKEYPFNAKRKKKNDDPVVLRQTIALSRGVRYKFLAVEDKAYEGKPVIAIYNNDKQEILLATTYNPMSKKFYDEIEFECKTTGNFCLTFSFHDGQEGCAIGLSGFLK